MTLFEKMGYDKETCETLNYARRHTGLKNTTLVILHENTKAGNNEFLEKVNDFVINKCKSVEDANNFIQENNPIVIKELAN